MTPDTAKVALQFMQRVTLQGSEVRAWSQVVAELGKIANGEKDEGEASSEHKPAGAD